MESSTMCSKVDELSHPEGEEEENSNELSTTPDSYPEYIPRFTFNKRQKSSLGRFRLNRLGATQPTSKIETNDDLSENSDSSHYRGPFSIKTHTGISWMRETPGKNGPSVTFGSASTSEPPKSIEDVNKICNSKSERSVNISENDSGLDISYPSNMFSNTKNEGGMSIFKPTLCKRNILFNNPYNDSEDKENLFHTSEGTDCPNQQNPVKSTQQSARPGLFGNRATNNFDDVSDFSKPLDTYSSSGIEREKQPFETNAEKVSLFNQKSHFLKNIPVSNNAPIKEYKENEIQSKPADEHRKTIFDSKPNLFENKMNLNAENNDKTKNSASSRDIELRSQECQKMDMFRAKLRVNDSQELSGTNKHLATSLKNETHRVPYSTQLAHGTIFNKPFIFTASLKAENDTRNVSDDSVSTPLDLSSGEYFNKTNFNNSEQNLHPSDNLIVKNSVSNTKETVNLTDSGMDNIETVNDSGINVSNQDKINTHDQVFEPEPEINLLPTPLVLACPRSKSNLFISGGSALKTMDTQPALAEHSNNINSDIKHTDQNIPLNSHNSEHTLLKCYNIQNEKPFLQSGLTQEFLNTKKPEYQSHLNEKQSVDIPPENNQLQLNSNLISVKKDSDMNQHQSNSSSTTHQPVSTTYQPVSNQSHNYHPRMAKPEVETICPSKQTLQNFNLKVTKSDVEETATPQKQSFQCENLEMAKSQIPVCREIFTKSSYHNGELSKPEATPVIPQLQQLNKNQNLLRIHSTDINKHQPMKSKAEQNQLHGSSVPQHLTEQKPGGVQLFPSALFPSNKLCSKEKPEIAENHQNLYGQPSVIDLSGKQLPIASSQNGCSYSLDPKTSNNKNNSTLFSTVPYQQSNAPQQSVSHQQQSSVSNMHYKPQENPITNFGNQSKPQVHQSAVKLQHAVAHMQSANAAQSYNIKNNEFIKPSNPAPRYIDRLPTLKNKPTVSRPISNRQSNFSISPGMLPQMNKVLYVNGKAYTILSTLGKGGSSEVYQVLDPNTSTLMAIKCVDLTMVDQSIADGYLNEIDLLSKLQGCATVIKMFDHEYVKESKMLYVVMEKGDTDLSKLIRDVCKTAKISISMMLYYWTEMLAAVRDIHERGIIHSDLKPANFLLVSGRLKLIDFGIASSLQGDMTSVQKEVTSGTWNYMSPEAIRNTGGSGQGYKITYRSDVWSLGCILYNLVYGKTPFSHITHTWSKLHAIADPNHKIEFPFRNIPPVLDRALKSCFHRDPKQRPTVAQLLKMPYQTTVDKISLGLEVKKILPTESWVTVQHLFSDAEKQENKTETESTS